MKRISRVELNKNTKRADVYLDGRLAFSLPAGLALGKGLASGQELDDRQVESLAEACRAQRCYDDAARFLTYRPRSESEVRNHLAKRGFKPATVETVIGRLKALGLVDDAAFARFWSENRASFSPRSRSLTSQELKQKGVGADIVTDAVAVDDEESAYNAALIGLRRLPVANYPDFNRRLGNFLRRRGFNYEVISHTLERVWREFGSSPDRLGAGSPGTKSKGGLNI
ncbi:MAG: RecX family transcriptional regulator [Chloroflexi bacterium]|nr:RecX family transcriptional regulator [Chloroflexota bacterium]